MNESKKSVTTFSFKKIFESITFKNRVFCVLKVSGANGRMDILGFQLPYGWKVISKIISKIILNFHIFKPNIFGQ